MSEMRIFLEFLGGDGAAVTRVAVESAWQAAIESVGFEAARHTRGALVTALAHGSVTPVWDDDRGEPYVGAFRVDVPLGATSVYSKQISIAHFAAAAASAAQDLAERARPAVSTPIHYRVLALAEAPIEERTPDIEIEEVAEPLPVAERSLASLLTSGTQLIGPHHDEDVPVVIDGGVAAAAVERALASPDIETGALLAGHLCRDPQDGDLFVHIAAGLPAMHTIASSDRLTFTADTWAAGRDALQRRGRGELLLGWQHHHRPFCSACPAERRRDCPLRDNFFSADDRHLHASVFDRAFHVALLVSLDVERPPALSLYGWRDGTVQRRGFYLTSDRIAPIEERAEP